MKSWVLLKESYQARRGLTFTTNIHTSLHLTTESHLYSDLWSISLCTPVSTPSSLFSYLPPLFFRFISLYLPPPLLSCSFPAQLFLLVSVSRSPCASGGFLYPPCCQAGFPAGEASEEEKKEQLQRERNTDSHQGDPQEEGRVVLQTAGVDFLFLFSFVNYWDVCRDNE